MSKVKNTGPCGCGESNYSFMTAQKHPRTRINMCRKCGSRWLTDQNPPKNARRFERDEDE